MLSKNNYDEKAKRASKQVLRYGLRKLDVGVVSALLGTTFLFVGGANADSTTSPAPVNGDNSQAITQKSSQQLAGTPESSSNNVQPVLGKAESAASQAIVVSSNTSASASSAAVPSESNVNNPQPQQETTGISNGNNIPFTSTSIQSTEGKPQATTYFGYRDISNKQVLEVQQVSGDLGANLQSSDLKLPDGYEMVDDSWLKKATLNTDSFTIDVAKANSEALKDTQQSINASNRFKRLYGNSFYASDLRTSVPAHSYGVDVSAYQNTDLSTDHANGAQFAIIKTTESTDWTNKNGVGQVASAKANNMMIMGYHFARFGGDTQRALAEANFAINTARSMGIPEHSYFALDFETNPWDNTQSNTDAALAFMQAVQKANYQPLLYSGAYFAKSHFYLDQITKRFPNSLWIAAYKVKGRIDTPDFNYFPGIADGIAIWQFTDNWRGLGVDGNVNVLPLQLSEVTPTTVKATYRFIDDDDNGKVVKTVENDVTANSDYDASGLALPTNMHFTDSSSLKGKVGAIDLTIDLRVKHNLKEVQTNNTVIRNITVENPDGTKETSQQKATFTRKGSEDLVTNNISWGPEPESATLPAYAVKNIPGYTVVGSAPAIQVNYNTPNSDVIIKYQKNPASGDVSSPQEDIVNKVKEYGVTPNTSKIINVSEKGLTGDGKTDVTSQLQQIFDEVGKAGGGIVYFPAGQYMVKTSNATNQAEATIPWQTNQGLKVPSNTTLYFEKGAKLVAIPNASWNYTMLNLANVHDVNILNGELVGDRDNHDLKYTLPFHRTSRYSGETGWGILLTGSKDINILGNNIHDFWGDGIDLYGDNANPGINTNIVIKNNVLNHNRRQGISVENVNGLIFDHNIVENTDGTAPRAGMDIEPANFKDPSMRIAHDITITNNIFRNNNGSGLMTYGLSTRAEGFSDGPSRISNLTIKNNTFDGNNTNSFAVEGTAGEGAWNWQQNMNGQLTVLGTSNATVENNKFINPNPKGINEQESNGDSSAVIAPNTYKTAGMFVGFNENAQVHNNYLPGQDIFVTGNQSPSYAFTDISGSVTNNYARQVIANDTLDDSVKAAVVPAGQNYSDTAATPDFIASTGVIESQGKPKPTISHPAVDPLAQRLVTAAKSLLGYFTYDQVRPIKAALNGDADSIKSLSDVDKNGKVDCSGFVWLAMKLAGEKVVLAATGPWYTGSMAQDATGKKVYLTQITDPTQLQPGDIIIVNKNTGTGNDGHTAILNGYGVDYGLTKDSSPSDILNSALPIIEMGGGKEHVNENTIKAAFLPSLANGDVVLARPVALAEQEPETNPDEEVTVAINYLDGQTVVKTDQLKGKLNSTVSVSLSVPENYHLEGSVPTFYTFTKENNPINVQLGHNTKSVSQSKTVTRTVNIQLPSGTKSTSQSGTIVRNGELDLVTNQTNWGDWSKESLDAVDIPQIDGYVASQKQVPQEVITSDSQANQVVNVTYLPVSSKASINYLDNGKVIKQVPLTGKTGETINISLDVPENYHVIGSVPTSYTFSSNNEPVVINLAHDLQSVSDSKTVTRTINFISPTFNKTTKQSATITRTGEKDLVTGQVNWKPWTTDKFDEVQVPQVDGMTADKTSIAAQEVNEDSKDSTVDVHYTPSTPQTLEVVIKYMDNGDVVKTEAISGVSGQTIKLALQAPENYQLTGDIPSSVQLGDTSETITVNLAHKTNTVQDTKTLYRNIHIKLPEKTKEIKQTVMLARTGEKDLVTGKTSWNPWSTEEFPALTVPTVDGYKASSEIPASKVDGNSPINQELSISYEKVNDNKPSSSASSQTPNSASSTPTSSAASAISSDSGSASTSTSSANPATSSASSVSDSASIPSSSANTSSEAAASSANNSASQANSSIASETASNGTSTASQSVISEDSQSNSSSNYLDEHASDSEQTSTSPANEQVQPAVPEVVSISSPTSIALSDNQRSGDVVKLVGGFASDTPITSSSVVSNNGATLPQTGNNHQELLAALGLSALGIVGTTALGYKKKY